MKPEIIIKRLLASCKVVVIWLITLNISGLISDIKSILKDNHLAIYNKVFAIIKKIATWIGSLGIYTMVKSVSAIWK